MEAMFIGLKTEEDLKKAKELGFVHLKPRRAYPKDYYVGLHYFRYGFKQSNQQLDYFNADTTHFEDSTLFDQKYEIN
jgi:hypothetical protein